MADDPGLHDTVTSATEHTSRESGADPDALLATVGEGDERAFEQLYELVSAAVFGLIQRIVRDYAQAEEVTQEVLVDVWRKARQYDRSKGSARTWILTFAHRRAVDRVRSAQATSERETRDATRSSSQPFDTVSESVLGNIEQVAVRRCMETLTKLQRESVVFTYYRGYSYTEAASMLGTPPPTLKTRVRDGLIRLRDCLGVRT